MRGIADLRQHAFALRCSANPPSISNRSPGCLLAALCQLLLASLAKTNESQILFTTELLGVVRATYHAIETL